MINRLLARVWLRRSLVIVQHGALWAAALLVALELRFDGNIPVVYIRAFSRAVFLLVATRAVAFWVSGLFHGLWRYSGMPELRNLVRATTGASIAFVAMGALVHSTQLPRSAYVGEWLASIVLVGGVRFVIRLLRESRVTAPMQGAVPTLIIGAGDDGESLLRDVQRLKDAKWDVAGFLDDDTTKVGALVRDVRVLGAPDAGTLRRVVAERSIGLIVLAMPSASGARMRDIVAVCRELHIQTKTVPSLEQRVNGALDLSSIREIAIDDLLRRSPVELELDSLSALIEGRTVLVTGAGGSIGSEIARQVLRFQAKTVILLDHDENAVFFIERELLESYSKRSILPVIADITDELKVRAIFKRLRPDVVFHAAAHKHVPMMERNACEAVKNNVLGTRTLVDEAHAAGVDAFVMISTDKAVNPTSVMGATKRVAEMIVQARAESSETRFVAVRFGNVLGSAGSVVPLFKEQISKGGPVTVTHPDMRRYFMTIHEAVQLVLQAGSIGMGGEIFLLDMGEPVKISDLARDMIELSGLRPDIDVEIRYTGLRPGEKLFEELLHTGEGYDQTRHPKIVAGRIKKTPAELLHAALNVLAAAAAVDDDERVRVLLGNLVPQATLAASADPEIAQERSSCLSREATADAPRFA